MEFNKTKSPIEEKFLSLVNAVMPETGLELYEMEYIPSSSTLVLFIIDPETNSAVIEDCVKVDRALSEPFEELNWIPESIRLEVSSPGVYRKLTTLKHFEKAQSERVSVTLSKKLDEALNLPKKILSANPLIGALEKIEEDKIVLNIDESEVEIGFEYIKKANLEPKF